jgi:hypothetical protein
MINDILEIIRIIKELKVHLIIDYNLYDKLDEFLIKIYYTSNLYIDLVECMDFICTFTHENLNGKIRFKFSEDILYSKPININTAYDYISRISKLNAFN